MFSKEDRGKFKYTFAHWCAFQMTALNLGCWKFKYLFHDIEKPILRLFFEYKTVQRIHRRNNRHHLEYKGGLEKIDWEAFVIDNESCRFTKSAAPLTAKEFYESLISGNKVGENEKEFLTKNVPPVLKRLGLCGGSKK